MAKRDDRTQEVGGLFVYHTDKHKNVYYDIFTRTAHVISRSEISQFNMFSMRFVAALLVGFAAYFYLRIDPLVSIVLGLATYLVIYLIFRLTLLKQLTVIDKFTIPENEKYTDRVAEDFSMPKFILMIVLALAFIILSFINTLSSTYSGSTLVMNYGLVVLGFVILITYLIALKKKLKK